MYFLKKAWLFAMAAIVVGVGVFFFGRANKPGPPVTIYKAVQPAPKANVTQNTRAEVADHVYIPPESTSEVGHRGRSPIELRETEGEEVTSNAEGDTNKSMVGEEPTPHLAKGEVPPELSREAMERRHEDYRQQQRVLEIMEEIRGYANNSVTNREDTLRVLELQEELLRIQQKRGLLEQTGGDVFKALEFSKIAATHTTDDGRFPTAKASVLIEGIRELTPDFPEKQVALERLNQVVATAMENGDEYLDLNLFNE
ncbi:MAG: hypothetical protein OXI63_17870 [Candidatus Poribacteria bacterium]|nr:hypothetical protein [Candidatus Poribacteria bacterium]